MKLTVRLYASLRDHAPSGQSDLTIEMADGATVADVVARLGIPPEIVRKVFVDGIAQDPDRVLHDGDEVGMFPPIAGGAPRFV